LLVKGWSARDAILIFSVNNAQVAAFPLRVKLAKLGQFELAWSFSKVADGGQLLYVRLP